MPVFTRTGIFGKLPGQEKPVYLDPKELEVASDFGKIGVPAVIWDAPKKAWESIKKYGKKEEKEEVPEIPKPEKKGEKKGSPFYRNYDFDTLMTEYAFKRLLGDVKDNYNVYFMPLKELNERFPCDYTINGWEEGDDIYVANDISVEDMLKALSHEVLAKDLRYKTEKTHDELHPEIFAREEELIRAYKSKPLRELRI